MPPLFRETYCQNYNSKMSIYLKYLKVLILAWNDIQKRNSMVFHLNRGIINSLG